MDESSLQLVSEIGRHLAHRTRPNKDFLVKSLGKAANALALIKQSPQPRTAKEVQAAKKQEDALKPLANAVVCGGLLQHADKEVRLLVAMCVTDLFRIMAPVPPFEDKHLRDVFKLIISLFEDLADTASPFFSKRVKVLETMAQLKCCVIMLEIDCIDLVLEMFNIFFSVVRDEHLLISAMTSIMINILNESEEAFQQLLEVILQNLIRQNKDAIFTADKLAASVIKACAQEDELNSLVCGFLTTCIHDRDAMGSELKEYYNEIFSKVFQCAPEMLLDVIPSLIKELSADEVDVRIKAVNLVGMLFALQHHVVQKYHELFVEFLKRFSDKSVDVRISALQCAKAFYLANPYDGTESREIMTSVGDRLLDSDDQVRKQAVLVACDIFSSNLKLITVRKSALQKLIKVYRDYCKKCYEGSMTISDHFEEIPCKIMMLCYDKDCKEFRFQNIEFVLANDLFPEDLSVEERTNHWMHMFSLFSFPHEKALDTILTQKRRFQNEMKSYLAMRKKLKAIVRNFPSMLKGLEKQFQKLLEQKSPVNDKLIEVIAKAGSHMSFNHSDIYPLLKRICLDGTRRQAKFAGSAIAALSFEQSVFRKLYEELVDSLYSKRNVPTILQSLGFIAQYSVSNFETQVEEITSYICQKIIQMEHLDDGHYATSFHDTSQCSESCRLKIYGLKTLVKISLHCEGSHVKHNINGVLDILSRMLRESDNFISIATGSCESDKAHIRLAAAKAILRLARKWDLHITPDIFRFTILIAKDSSFFVRSTFLSKTQKLLKEHKLPIRFACAFALAVTDGTDDLQYQDYSILARRRQTSAVQGVIIDYPAYILVFLIHVLARNNDFPFEALVDISIVEGAQDIVNDAVLHVISIFRAIRKVEDAIDAQITPKLHMLAEIGIFILNEFNHGGISVLQTPGQILLPSSLYRVSLIKNDTSSKCPKSFFDEKFLSRVFHALKESTVPHGYAQKPAKTLPKHGHKGQQDVKKSNVNIYGVLDSASSKPDDLSRREIANAKAVRPNIPSVKRGKCVPSSGSGTVGLHECSMTEKQQKIASKHCEKTIERNMLSSSDSVRFKGSLTESHVPTRKSKRAAACSSENAVTSSKHTVEPSKCRRTKRKDTCGSKKQEILEDVSNKNRFSLHEPDEYSSLGSIKTTVTRRVAANKGTPLNKENTNVNERGKCIETSASEVVNTNACAVRRTRRKV
ncbi:Sister chromatid cohesion protein PDS5 A-B [Glycine max]|nr:Sister chromatid cohesion protein PDS5 A-B [Glycine max]